MFEGGNQNLLRMNKMQEKKIVIVDDDDSIRKTFFMILHDNYRVYLAKDPKEALHRFKKADVDLIIADLKLPDISGLEMISRFREAGYRGEAILISGFPDMIDMDELNRLSIGHFFVKPLDLNALNHSIEYLLNGKNGKEKRV
jgi:two-component system response regulator (stage 0 sporulation protein F)